MIYIFGLILMLAIKAGLYGSSETRLLFLLTYLNTQTDEEHPVTIAEIIEHLNQAGFACGWKSVKGDIEQLIASGADVVCNKSRELQYFIGGRQFELAELKMLVDAVQTFHFSEEKQGVNLQTLADDQRSPVQPTQPGFVP